jgi:hypothetical protein
VIRVDICRRSIVLYRWISSGDVAEIFKYKYATMTGKRLVKCCKTSVEGVIDHTEYRMVEKMMHVRDTIRKVAVIVIKR